MAEKTPTMIIFIVGKLMDLPRVLIINWVFWKIEPRKHIVTILTQDIDERFKITRY